VTLAFVYIMADFDTLSLVTRKLFENNISDDSKTRAVGTSVLILCIWVQMYYQDASWLSLNTSLSM
jgi:hypothetical protein